jgi:hypothetical protein
MAFTNNSPRESLNERNSLLRRSRVSSRIISLDDVAQLVNINMTTLTDSTAARGVVTIHIFIISENGKSFMKTVQLNISEADSVEKVIKQAVKVFNTLFDREKLGVQLREGDLSLYKLKPSKKNGLPKDLPSKGSFNDRYGF